jgi:hypothetical protein
LREHRDADSERGKKLGIALCERWEVSEGSRAGRFLGARLRPPGGKASKPVSLKLTIKSSTRKRNG